MQIECHWYWILRWTGQFNYYSLQTTTEMKDDVLYSRRGVVASPSDRMPWLYSSVFFLAPSLHCHTNNFYKCKTWHRLTSRQSPGICRSSSLWVARCLAKQFNWLGLRPTLFSAWGLIWIAKNPKDSHNIHAKRDVRCPSLAMNF